MVLTLDILDRLVGFPTISAASNLDIIGYIEDFLKSRGFRTYRVPDATGQKAGLFAALGPTDVAGVLLSGHTDVVPVAGQTWTRDPFRLTQEGERLYGRGTTDMKGYLACMLSLADRAAKVDLKEPLKLAFSYDEEIGCVGIRQMIDQLPPTIGLPRACFVGEPTEMQVAIGHKGKTALRATCHGESGHSAMAPRFLNAVHVAADFVGALRDVQDDLARNGAQDAAYHVPYSTVHVGKIVGGTALNIVPDRAVVDFEFRNLVSDPGAMLRQRIDMAADRVASGFGQQHPAAKIAIEQVNTYPGLDADPASDVVILAQELAQSASRTKVAFGTEAGVFASVLNIPTVVCGPGSMADQGHKPDESIGCADLAACDAFCARLLDQLVC